MLYFFFFFLLILRIWSKLFAGKINTLIYARLPTNILRLYEMCDIFTNSSSLLLKFIRTKLVVKLYPPNVYSTQFREIRLIFQHFKFILFPSASSSDKFKVNWYTLRGSYPAILFVASRINWGHPIKKRIRSLRSKVDPILGRLRPPGKQAGSHKIVSL